MIGDVLAVVAALWPWIVAALVATAFGLVVCDNWAQRSVVTDQRARIDELERTVAVLRRHQRRRPIVFGPDRGDDRIDALALAVRTYVPRPTATLRPGDSGA